MKTDQQISKFLSLVLRHQPQAAGLQLDPQGWVEVDQLLAQFQRRGWPLDRPRLEQVVATDNKQRYAFDASGQRIRANQGHSVTVDLALEPQVPPAVLYHGTAQRFLASIQQSGLLPQSRQHVHLSAEVETALKVGSRHGQPVVLQVNAAAMHQAGQVFYQAANGVWLTGLVAPHYLVFEEKRNDGRP
jgi:putative RNA 2'-phosphotransferase